MITTDAIKEWAIMLCAVAVGSVFCVFLVPDGKLKKSAEVGVVLFVLLLVLSPLRNNRLSDFDSEFHFEKTDDSFEFNSIDLYGEYAEKIISAETEKILEAICDQPYSYEINLSAEGENEIVLKSIIIFIKEKDADKKTDIITKVGNLTGIVPEVMIEVET